MYRAFEQAIDEKHVNDAERLSEELRALRFTFSETSGQKDLVGRSGTPGGELP